ncbi:MAG: hypothetical protein U1F09_09775 [Steroidobacteraceae bacterium]
MDDRSPFWSPVPDWSSAKIRTSSLDVRVVLPVCAWQLSGEWGSVLTRLGVGAVRGPRDRCGDSRYALRLSPDSVLLVSDAPVDLAAGWHEAGYAATALGDALVLVDLEGAGASALMAAGSEYPFSAAIVRPLESARMQLAGHTIAVSRRPSGWRLHVPRPWATALWRWLEAHSE